MCEERVNQRENEKKNADKPHCVCALMTGRSRF